MKLTKMIGVVAILGLTLGRFQLALAVTETVPVTDLSLVEESSVGCPECDAAKAGLDTVGGALEHDGGGHGGHDHGGHGGHDGGGHGGHGGHDHGGHGGHGGHDGGGHGGHGGHDHGGHGGHGHWGHWGHWGHGHGHHHFDLTGNVDGSNLPQPSVELK